MHILISTALLFISLFSYGQQVQFTVAIDNLENTEGSVIISVFKDQKTFADETPYKVFRIAKAGHMEGDVFEAQLSLPADTYGIALVDDTNNDGEMEFSWMGLPQEGYGFSNYYHTGISRPTFEDFAFNLNPSTGTLKMKMKYL